MISQIVFCRLSQRLIDEQSNQANSSSADKVKENFCKRINCSQSTTCHSCEFTGCCQFNITGRSCLELKESPFNYTELLELRNQVEIKNLSIYPDPQRNVTFPKCNILTEVPLFNATNYLYKNHDVCGIPSYCPNQQYLISSEGRVNFQQQKTTVNQGELCTIYFEGRMGPDFLIEIGVGNISLNGIKVGLSICLSVGMFDHFPCIDFTQQLKLQNNIFYKIRANQFRITLQFYEDAELDFSQLYYYIISHQKLTQQYQQQLFQFVVILLLTILSSIVIIAIFKALLIKLFGRNLVAWIDPEPLFPVRRSFNSADEMKKLLEKQLIRIIQPEEIQFEQDRCSFCLESFQNGVILEIFCGHCFHQECLITHFKTQMQIGKCSICQTNITLLEKSQTPKQKQSSLKETQFPKSLNQTESEFEIPIISQQHSSID